MKKKTRRFNLQLLYFGLFFMALNGRSATPFELGETIGSNIARGGVRVFTFSGHQNQSIGINASVPLRPHGTPSVKFQLLSPGEERVLATVATRLGRPAQIDQLTLADDGLYTAILFDETGFGFDRDLAWLTIVDNRSPEALLPLNGTTTATLEVSDIDVYGFEARAGETAVLSVEASEVPLQLSLTVIGPDGRMIGSVEEEEGVMESLTLALPENGLYTVLIKDLIANDEGMYTISFAIHVPGDGDVDGLEDDWEREAFGDLSQSSNDDLDMDGVSNRAEFVQGMNPLVRDTNGNETAPLLSIRVQGFGVEFLAARGGQYQLEGTADFVDWLPVGRVIYGNDQTVKRSVSVSDGQLKFFRLVTPKDL